MGGSIGAGLVRPRVAREREWVMRLPLGEHRGVTANERRRMGIDRNFVKIEGEEDEAVEASEETGESTIAAILQVPLSVFITQLPQKSSANSNLNA